MDREKTLFICSSCQKVIGCDGILSPRGLYICDGEHFNCPTKGNCHVKKFPSEYNYFHIISDGLCTDCYESQLGHA